MTPKPQTKHQDEQTPALEQADWEALADDSLDAEARFQNGDIRYEEDETPESLEEEDDNPYQESDEALPDDDEERAIARRMGDGGERPGEE